MSEEASAVTTETTSTTPVTETSSPASMADIYVKDQGLTEISEAELRGEDQTSEEGESAEESQGESAESASEAKSTEEVKAESQDTESTPPKAEPPPKGFVPTAALKEARDENRQLKERIRQLEARAPQAPTETPPPVPNPEFKVLTKAEFQELSEESPREALLYMQELQEYKDAERAKQEYERQNIQRAQEIEYLFEEAVEQMTAAVPGLFDEGSTAQQELATFAEELGFTNDMFYLTNPETQVILPGQKEPLYLGSQAASIIKMLATAKNKIQGASPDAIRKSVEAELKPKLEAQLLSKVKSGSKKPFVSMADIPTSASTAPLKGVLTEVEYARLSPSEQQAYLSGNA